MLWFFPHFAEKETDSSRLSKYRHFWSPTHSHPQSHHTGTHFLKQYTHFLQVLESMENVQWNLQDHRDKSMMRSKRKIWRLWSRVPIRGQSYDHSWSASTPLVYKNGSVVPVIGITPKSIKMLWELSWIWCLEKDSPLYNGHFGQKSK